MTHHPATPDQPLHALWQRYAKYRGRFIGAATASTINKIADVMPEILFGAAVDVVVRGKDGVVLPGVTSGQGAVLDLAATPHTVWLRVSRNGGPGNARPVLNPVNLELEEGQAVYVFAVGSVSAGTFQYLVQVNP